MHLREDLYHTGCWIVKRNHEGRFWLGSGTALISLIVLLIKWSSVASTASAFVILNYFKYGSETSFYNFFCRSRLGKSGPPTHQGIVLLNIRGMYEVRNCGSSVDPVPKDRLLYFSKACNLAFTTSLLASESLCATNNCGRARSKSRAKSSNEKLLSAGVAALSVPAKSSFVNSDASCKTSNNPSGR